MAANDTAGSQAEAVERVLRVLTGELDPYALRRAASGPGSTLTPPPGPEWKGGPDDEAGALTPAP